MITLRCRARDLRHIVAAIAIGCAGGSPSVPSDRPPPPAEEERSSDAAGSSGRLWTDPVDFLALRTEYGDRSDFSQICEAGRPVRQWNKAAGSSDWPALLSSTAKWLESCPVDIDAHLLSAVAHDKSGQPVEAGAHVAWFRGLVDSVLGSGSGKSATSPFIVISVAEEYAVLRALQLQPSGQSLLNGGIDAINATDASGNESTVYFLPSAHWRRLEKAVE